MILAPIPDDEEKRNLDLLSYHILDTEEEEDYSALVGLAADICRCEGAAISFIDRNRQWFKASKNMPSTEMPRDISFCGHTILRNAPTVIDDTKVDERFYDNPLVIGEFNVGFYAGAPIISAAGYKLGTVCVLDHHPKHQSLDDEQRRALEVIAGVVKRLLELRSINRLTVDQANKLVEAEKHIARLNTIQTEKLNDDIAYELHENIAQVAAVAKMKTEVLSRQKNIDVKAFAELEGYIALILKDVRLLSYKVSPTTLKTADYRGFIEELMERTRATKNIHAVFSSEKSDLRLSKDFGLNVYRIIEYFLSFAELAEGKNITVELLPAPLRLVMHHDGSTDLTESDEAAVLQNNIRTRAEIIGSSCKRSNDSKTITVVFPKS